MKYALASLFTLSLFFGIFSLAYALNSPANTYPASWTDGMANKAHTRSARLVFTQPIPTTVFAELKKAQIPLSSVSILVEPVGASSPILSLNAKKPMNPASTMKLLTTFAGLSLLGPTFQWETRAYIDGPIQDGVLHGNLYIYGTGDPKLVPETLIHFINIIHSAGITRIEGDIVLDRSYFDFNARSAKAYDLDQVRAYNVGPDPLLYAFNALTFTLVPQPDQSVYVQVEPELSRVQLANTLRVTRGNCLLNPISAPIIKQYNGILRIAFQGTYPLTCGMHIISQAVPDHTAFFADGFLTLWEQTGGTHSGIVREAMVPPKAQCIAVYKGQSLQDSVRDINKNSNNTMARNLFLTLGATLDHPPATLERSKRVIRHWLHRERLKLPGLVLDNGAGLSSKERISAEGFTALLQHAIRSPVAQPLLDSLPIAGLDGTMRHRLSEGPSVGHIHIKTGTLENVRAIAGVITARNAKNYIVVSFINHPYANRAQAAHDALLKWTYDMAP